MWVHSIHNICFGRSALNASQLLLLNISVFVSERWPTLTSRCQTNIWWGWCLTSSADPGQVAGVGECERVPALDLMLMNDLRTCRQNHIQPKNLHYSCTSWKAWGKELQMCVCLCVCRFAVWAYRSVSLQASCLQMQTRWRRHIQLVTNSSCMTHWKMILQFTEF